MQTTATATEETLGSALFEQAISQQSFASSLTSTVKLTLWLEARDWILTINSFQNQRKTLF